jgi:hypothetical protein
MYIDAHPMQITLTLMVSEITSQEHFLYVILKVS